jgi:gamma-glutamylcyclotransferase (GGCT)/AIG2-like uncharacterized protein YtfP
MYVFSYGTLKDKYSNNYFTEAILEDFFELDTIGMYPILRYSNTLNSIDGFLIEVNKKELIEIDKYEDYPYLYDRVKRKINNVDAWVYLEPKGKNNE